MTECERMLVERFCASAGGMGVDALTRVARTALTTIADRHKLNYGRVRNDDNFACVFGVGREGAAVVGRQYDELMTQMEQRTG